MDVLDDDLAQGAKMMTGLWWLVLLAGVAWFLVGLICLRFDTTSVTTVGVLLGFVLLGGALTEVMEAMVVASWQWVHWVLAALFLLGAVWCFASPDDAFWSLASVLGLLLVLKGTFDIILAVESRHLNPVWGLGLAAGILELLLGFWASQQFYPARAALILVWVAFMAFFRGAMQITIGLQLRRAHRELEAAL